MTPRGCPSGDILFRHNELLRQFTTKVKIAVANDLQQLFLNKAKTRPRNFARAGYFNYLININYFININYSLNPNYLINYLTNFNIQ
jgi:hypothetical protein